MSSERPLTPRRSDRITVDPQEDGIFVIAVHDRETLCVTNATGRLIMDLCDGVRTTADIAAELTRRFEVDAAKAESDVATFVRTGLEKGILA